MRHLEQTNADRQRRITESYSKAVEQLASEKIEVRLGGIYTLERISKESPGDYWTIMETLTAFVRERARWKESDTVAMESMARFDTGAEEQGSQAKRKRLPTDIAAVLTVIQRRNLERERGTGWVLDLQGADLRDAHLGFARLKYACLDDAHLDGAFLVFANLECTGLRGAHFEGSDLHGAFLEDACLDGAHLEGANLRYAHLEIAELWETHLGRADLRDAHLEGAKLYRAHLEGADLRQAYLEGTDLREAHLEGADLTGATGLKNRQVAEAFGDVHTKLPRRLARPAHWPEAAPEEMIDRDEP